MFFIVYNTEHLKLAELMQSNDSIVLEADSFENMGKGASCGIRTRDSSLKQARVILTSSKYTTIGI